MEERIDAPAYFFHRAGNGSKTFFLTYAFSAIVHLAFFVILIFAPGHTTDKKFFPAVINVSMVTLPGDEKGAKAEKQVEQASRQKKTVVSRPSAATSVKVSSKPQDTVSVAPKKKKVKRSLKKKTFKPARAVKSAITRIEETVEETKPPPLKEAFERLEKTVVTKEAIDRLKQKHGKDVPGQPTGVSGVPGAHSKKILEIIDIYRLEIAYKVQKNWAFSGQLAGDTAKLQASLVFKVMPSGEIKGVFFTDRSGNSFLDESAYKAIIKSNPVDPHPVGVLKPYVNVGLRFTPEGVR